MEVIVLIVASLVLVASSAWVARHEWRRRQCPPGPRGWPIIGNMLQLGLNPHKSLAHLSKTYGPLMSLHLGTQFAIVASSPQTAMEVLQKHGLDFANGFTPNSACVLGRENISMGMLPVTSPVWRKLRRLAKEELFSEKALQASRPFRRDTLSKLADHVAVYSGTVMNIGESTFVTVSNLMFGTIFSVEFFQYAATDSDSDSVAIRKFKDHVKGITRYMGVPNIADFIPMFAPFDPQGLRRKLEYHLGGVLELVQTLVEERLQARTASSNYHRKNDFLETLIDLYQGNEYDMSIQEIMHTCVDLVIAGTDSTGATTEWTMLELLLHPDKLAKLKAELKSVVGDKRIVEESDVAKLPYLQATIKEALRFHPAAPLLIPHIAQKETRLNGYVIPQNTQVFVNYWAITRDPAVWRDPECFEPERFLGSGIDFGGQHFELIPFSSGRKICPGMPLATRVVHCMVATLCHNFDWQLENGDQSKQFHREDMFGLALQKKTPLRAIPIKV